VRLIGAAAVAVVIGSMTVLAGAVPPVVAGPPAAAPGSHAAPAAAASASRPGRPDLKSNVALVFDEARGQALYAKNPDRVVPIASITKLMTAMVILDARLPMDETIPIDREDVDRLKHTRSRLEVGAQVTRGDLLWVALMSSENRAAAALARTYPGGTAACVAAMNLKALQVGMMQARFADASGLSSGNVASAEDLSRLVRVAAEYPEIRRFSTARSHTVRLSRGRVLEFHNSNGLVSNKAWTIGLSKTGYLDAAGRCLVMQAEIAARPVIIVLLDSWGKYTRLGDANRIRKWMEAAASAAGPVAATGPGAPTRAR